MRVLASVAVIVFLAFGMAVDVHAQIPRAPAAIQDAGCAVIDNNWESFGQQKLGANEKVTDVVLNACAAIGGNCAFTSGKRCTEDTVSASCPLNRGASNSQHLHGRALDVRVPRGKEKEFITYAICGLRRVNHCNGGIGLYTSGAIHIDVRSRQSAWSDGYGYNDIVKISDPQARQLLYDFVGTDKCSQGIVGDYSEQYEYGAPATNHDIPIPKPRPEGTIPNQTEEWQQAFGSGVGTAVGGSINYATTPRFESALGQSVSSSLWQTIFSNPATQMQQSSPALGRGSATFTSVFDDTTAPQKEQQFLSLQPFTTGERTSVSDRDSVGASDTLLSSPAPSQVRSSDSGAQQNTGQQFGVTTEQERIGSPQQQNGNAPPRTTPDTAGYARAPEEVSPLSRVLSAVRRGASTQVTYDTHTPTDTQQSGTGNVEFTSGVPRTTTPRTPTPVVAQTARAAGTSIVGGTYIGIINGLLPTTLGSFPRTAWVLGSGAVQRARGSGI